MRKIVITGASGFLGSRLAARLGDISDEQCLSIWASTSRPEALRECLETQGVHVLWEEGIDASICRSDALFDCVQRDEGINGPGHRCGALTDRIPWEGKKGTQREKAGLRVIHKDSLIASGAWGVQAGIGANAGGSMACSRAEVILRDAILVNCAYPRNASGASVAEGLEYTRDLFESAVRFGAKAIINISSQSVYSGKRKEAAAEDTALCLESGYAIGKYAVELMLEGICHREQICPAGVSLCQNAELPKPTLIDESIYPADGLLCQNSEQTKPALIDGGMSLSGSAVVSGNVGLSAGYASFSGNTACLRNVSLPSGTAFTSIRLASLIGPGFEQRIVNRFVKQALERGRISVKKNRQRFGFLDVDDAASAILRMLMSERGTGVKGISGAGISGTGMSSAGMKGAGVIDAGNYPAERGCFAWKPVYNLGPSRAYSLPQIAEKIKEVFWSVRDQQIVIDLSDGDEEGSSELDSSLFQRDFGFRPSVTLEESIEKILESYSEAW